MGNVGISSAHEQHIALPVSEAPQKPAFRTNSSLFLIDSAPILDGLPLSARTFPRAAITPLLQVARLAFRMGGRRVAAQEAVVDARCR